MTTSKLIDELETASDFSKSGPDITDSGSLVRKAIRSWYRETRNAMVVITQR